MSNETSAPTPYDELAYNELKKLASERGLNSSGTKEELKERLQQADRGAVDEGQMPSSAATAPAEPHAPTGLSAAPASRTKSDVDVKQRTKAQRTKAALDQQPKVMVFIPFDQGENPKEAVKTKFVVNINGYQFDIPRGTAVQVPEQVARMVAERLESEGKAAARAGRVDDDPAKQEALS